MSDRKTRTILLVDGSSATLFYHAMLLKRLEYKVEAVLNAEDALRIMEGNLPSIVVTDISLPNMDGITLLRRMKQTPRLNAIPVVMLMSNVDPEQRDACLRAGCATVLFRPVEPDSLYQTLQALSESMPRAHIRLAVLLRVILGEGAAAAGAPGTEYATAISEGGLFVRTLYPRPQDTEISMRIVLPKKEIKARVVVLYSVTAGPQNEQGMGMKFIAISDADRELIKDFIKEQLTKDIAAQNNVAQ